MSSTYLVKLQEYARALLLEVVAIFLVAWGPASHRNFADLALRWRIVERAINTIIFLLGVSCIDRKEAFGDRGANKQQSCTTAILTCQKLIDQIGPDCHVSIIGCFVPD